MGGWGLRWVGARRQGGHVVYADGPPLVLGSDREGRREVLGVAPVPTVCQVEAVVDGELRSGRLRCLWGSCRGVLAPWWWGVERRLVVAGGATVVVRPRRSRCRSCGVTRVLLPDSMLRRRQYHVDVVGAALVAAADGRAWTKIAAELGVPFETVRGWLRRFSGRAELVRAWLSGLLTRLVADPRVPAGRVGPVADALVVLAALVDQLPARWPLVSTLTRWQLIARLSRCDLLAPHRHLPGRNTSRPVTSVQVAAILGG
jgi:hypothetical protein